MEYLRKFAFALLLLTTLVAKPHVFAQDNVSLALYSPVEGEIGPSSDQTWTFNAVDGEVLSFVVHATSGTLDPQFTIYNSKGEPFLSNDDYAYPGTQDALLEAITMPRADTYRLTVKGVNSTSGSYTLTMLSGFSQSAVSDNFNGDLQWQDAKESSTTFAIKADSGRLNLAISGPDNTGIAINPKQTPLSDFYASVKVVVTGGSDGWLIGMTLRQTDNNNFYLLNVSSRGQWRLTRHQDNTVTIIRDWTDHPALVNSSGSFTLSAMVSGTGFDFFYNGILFGRLSDTALSETGVIGLSVGTFSSLSSQTNASFDDLQISTPTTDNGNRIVPQQIVLGQPTVLTRDLQRRGLIPASGKLALNVPESFIESARPGVDRVPLARGTTFAKLAIGTTVSWDSAAQGLTGCGLILQSIDDTNYTLAYIDHSGAFGVSRRNSDHFDPGIYAENPSGNGNKHSLIVILQNNQLLYYVDGLYRGSMPYTITEGSVGNAVVNFEPIRTSCKFTDTWVWNWDN